MAAQKKFTVGQHVFITAHHRVREGTVEKVGRTLVHVNAGSWGLEKFYMSNGRGGDNYGYGSHVYTDQEWAERAERVDLIDRFRKTGFVSYVGGEWTTDQLRRIIVILEEKEGTS